METPDALDGEVSLPPASPRAAGSGGSGLSPAAIGMTWQRSGSGSDPQHDPPPPAADLRFRETLALLASLIAELDQAIAERTVALSPVCTPLRRVVAIDRPSAAP